MRESPIIAIDFDNTIVDWVDSECVLKRGARQAMQRLKDLGCTIIIHTCRIGIAKETGNVAVVIEEIKRILEDFEIPYDSIHLGTKVIADAYIDDRAVAFRGDWSQACDDTEKLLFRSK